MGFNSRNSFLEDFKDHIDWVEYYVSRLEFLFQSLELKIFSLIAHSIGAYVATYYFDRYHQKIRKLILLSPAGFN